SAARRGGGSVRRLRRGSRGEGVVCGVRLTRRGAAPQPRTRLLLLAARRATIASSLGRNEVVVATIPTSNSAAPARPVTVLLIDDQPIVAESVRRMLADQPDVEFHYCQDPAKAIEKANSVKPTVILQDLVMPEIDGLMLVKFFRANKSTRDVPMIVLSSKEE